MRLSEVTQGTWVRVVGFEGGQGLRARLTQHGIYPGDRLRVLRVAPLGGPFLVEANGREVALGQGVAAKVLVEVEP
ncbi:MAG: ferrous iron transport protein A [Anaerolineae bacterium]|nr:MAG: ferrous iron transport protein A [Anaerolineae bacterium]